MLRPRHSPALLALALSALALGDRPASADTTAPSAAPSAAPAPAPAKHAYAVAAIGDSLTDAKSHGGKYLDFLRGRCPKSRFDNYGKGGQMVNQMRKRFARDVLGDPPNAAAPKPAYTHVIVFGGVNDIGSDLTAGRTPKKIETDLTTMYESAKQRGMKVVAITISPWGGFTSFYNPKRAQATRDVNDWIRAQLGLKKVDYVVDAFKLLSCDDPERLCPAFVVPMKDGLHFGPEGHKKLGAALFDQVFADCL